MHPMTGSLSELTTDELYAKYNELQRKINASYRLGYSSALIQLQMLMDDYQAEINRRHEKAMEEMQNRSKEFKNIIDIK